jgi:hypothetical protein
MIEFDAVSVAIMEPTMPTFPQWSA